MFCLQFWNKNTVFFARAFGFVLANFLGLNKQHFLSSEKIMAHGSLFSNNHFEKNCKYSQVMCRILYFRSNSYL